MKKILMVLLSSAFILSPTATIIACKNIDEFISYQDPDWIYQMKTAASEQFTVGYDNYYLPSARSSIQKDNWLDLNQESHVYVYFKNITNIDEVMKKLSFGDTANMRLVTQIYEPIIFTKTNNGMYISDPFLTQNTAVGEYTMMAQDKWQDIKNSKNMKQLNDRFQKEFEQYGTIADSHPVQGVNGTKFVWWDSNRWESLLQTDIQKAIYGVWSSTENKIQVGMNIPLSLVSKGSIKVSKTDVQNVFRIDLNYQEDWINNSFNKIKYLLPHWGFYFKIKGENNAQYVSPQLIPAINNAFRASNILTYLKSKKVNSFNTEGYKNAKIIS
ncbi:hypothetical protein [Spiroplasma sp. SV19]|uniref:hypothetical protein n=1 Tax=Spiroplasma sp. SV19 TaxID=2570468 RepID=UPI0024B75D3E|nr:hypothetical protein [Spiroplasma sp. SV19]WHQ37239.1 hypothetical protein E7Y35_05060 [Spiroplasma sp. SV19]